MTWLLVWTSSDSAAFARASTTALAGEGRAAGIACASVDGVELYMHPDVGVRSIGYDELIAVLLLRQQREHAVQPAPGLWNGRAGELDRAVGRLLLVTVAEVRLEDATLRRHRLREVCDPYMRMPSETTASVASPTDDQQEQTAHGRALPQSAKAEVARRPKSRALAAAVPVP